MFGWIIGASLKFRFLLLAFSVALLVFGTEQLRDIPVDVFPEFAPPKVEIQTMGPGMTATEVEELITIPMEDTLRGAPGIDYVRSKSVRGLSDIKIIFKMGEDIIEARRRVQELLDIAIAGLPQSSGMPVMLQPLSSTSRALKIGITSKKYDIMDLSMIAYWTCKRRRNTGPLRRPGSLAAGGLIIRHLIAFHLIDGRRGDVLSGTLSEGQAGLSP